MDKEIQDLAWQCLPKEARDFIKSDTATAWQLAYARIFGHHNLTSDEEPSELLFVERSKVMRKYKFANIYEKDHPDKKYWEGVENTLIKLFGDKCLPDIPSAGSGAMGTTPPSSKLDVKSDKEPFVQGEPRFKVGELIMSEGKVGRVLEYDSVREFPYLIHFPFNNSKDYRLKSDLQPYTEPETKEPECIHPDSDNCKWKNICDHTQCYFDPIKPETKDNSNMEEKELNLCELLKGCEEEGFYTLDNGCVVFNGIKTKDFRGEGITFLLFHATNFDSGSILINPNGKSRKYGEVILFPSRALYEKYPLDAYSAWMEWKEERTPKRWRAKQRETYWYFGRSFVLYQCTADANSDFDRVNCENGNMFRTEEEALQAVEAVKECLIKFHEQNKK